MRVWDMTQGLLADLRMVVISPAPGAAASWIALRSTLGAGAGAASCLACQQAGFSVKSVISVWAVTQDRHAGLLMVVSQRDYA